MKRDGRKCATSDLISNNKEPIKVLTLATKGKEVKQSIDKNQSANSKEKKLRVHKAQKELPLVETKSQPRCPLGLSYWRSENFNATYSYPYFGPPMPMSWMPPYAHLNSYSSWDRYDTRAHSPSYSRPSHQYYAAPRRSTFEQSRVKDRFNHKESVQSSRKKKEVVKQVYRIKRDGRKSAISDLISNEKEPIKVLTLATKGNEMKQPIDKNQSAKSEEKKLRVHKAQKELPFVETKSKPRCPLGLSYWRKKELQKLSAQELKKKNMAWVPKNINQDKNDVHASTATSAIKMKKEKNGSNKQLSRRCASQHQNFRLAHHPFSSTMPLMHLPWNSSLGMINYPPWIYFDPWMQHNFLYHEKVLPNHYTFG